MNECVNAEQSDVGRFEINTHEMEKFSKVSVLLMRVCMCECVRMCACSAIASSRAAERKKKRK